MKGVCYMFIADVVASKVAEGTTKDGRHFHFCQVWIELDDGSLAFFNSNADIEKGEKIQVGLQSVGANLRLFCLGRA